MGGKVLEHEAKTILQRGRQEGLQVGLQRGKQEGTISAYIGLIRDGLLSLAEAAVRLEMSEEELKKHI
jgi:predicted transposase YdaD